MSKKLGDFYPLDLDLADSLRCVDFVASNSSLHLSLKYFS